MMITGDSKSTATSIGYECGILSDSGGSGSGISSGGSGDNNVFTSQEFFSLPHTQQLQHLKTDNKIFCRSEPKDKQR